MHEVGDDAGRVGAQRLGGRVAAAAQEGLVEELADVGQKLDAQVADDVTRDGEQVLAHAHELGRTVAKELQDAVDDEVRVEHQVVLVRLEVGDERERLDLGGDEVGVDLLEVEVGALLVARLRRYEAINERDELAELGEHVVHVKFGLVVHLDLTLVAEDDGHVLLDVHEAHEVLHLHVQRDLLEVAMIVDDDLEAHDHVLLVLLVHELTDEREHVAFDGQAVIPVLLILNKK